MVEAHLAKAEELMVEGQRHLDDQRRIFAEIEHGDHDTVIAPELPATMEAPQNFMSPTGIGW